MSNIVNREKLSTETIGHEQEIRYNYYRWSIMNNEKSNGYTSRTERRKIEEELEKRNAAKEK